MNPLDRLAAAEKAFTQDKGIDAQILRGLTSVREQLHHGIGLDDTRTQTALWVAAPCLAAFAQWIYQQSTQYENPCFVGVMREGRILCQLMQTLLGQPAHELWVNRDVALRAAFAAGDEEALLNWMTRARLHPLSQGQALFSLTGETDSSAQAMHLLDVPHALNLIETWRGNGMLAKAKENAEQLSARLQQHWSDTTRGARTALMMDFACAGNIQRSLRTVFLAEGQNDPTIGLNFMTTQGVRWAKEKGCSIHGFIAEAGAPAWVAEPYTRTPELIEVFAAAPVGALKGYDEAARPVLAPDVLPPNQKEWLETIQPRLVIAAHLYAQKMGPSLSRELVRCVWGRLLSNPLPEEAEALGNWQLDQGIDGKSGRVLAPIGFTEKELDNAPRPVVAWPAAAQLRCNG